MNKLGIELAANFIIILILSIVMLGLAGGLTYKIMCASEGRIEQLDDASDRVIEQKLNSGAPVQVPVSVKSAKTGASFCGERGRAGVSYTLGVRNDDPAPHSFTIECTYKGYEQNGAIVSATTFTDCQTDWGYQASVVGDLEPKEKKTGLVVLNVPAGVASGKHVFTLKVLDGANQYGAVNVYLNVE